MKKNIVRMTTTDFYKNPSKAMNYVKDGDTVYLGYKNLKEPIAVLTDYNEYKADGHQKIDSKLSPEELKKKRMAVINKLKFKSKYWKSGLDLQKAVRQ